MSSSRRGRPEDTPPPAEPAAAPVIIWSAHHTSRSTGGRWRTRRSRGCEGSAGVVTGAGRGIGEACATDARRARRQRPAGRPRRRVAGRGRRRARESEGEASRLRVTDVRDWASRRGDAIASCTETFGGDRLRGRERGHRRLQLPGHRRPRAVAACRSRPTCSVCCTRSARRSRAMKAAGLAAHIVLMASIAGRQTWVGEPVYIATKWGVVGLGWALAQGGARVRRARHDDRARDGRHAARPIDSGGTVASSSGSRRSRSTTSRGRSRSRSRSPRASP